MKLQKFLFGIAFSGGMLLTTISVSAQGLLRDLPYWRPYDQRGLHVFETGKTDTVKYDGQIVRIGGAFTQQFQSLTHSNEATPNIVTDVNGQPVNLNQLKPLSPGFNLAEANLNIDAQLMDGVRLNMVLYLSTRHHTDTWVKGGYIQFDKLPFLHSAFFDNIMKHATIKVGHMEINYGDQHFRRTDAGSAIYNPFVGNYIMDAFTTEIGGEIYGFTNNGLFGMLSVTNGEIKGNVNAPHQMAPSIIGKIGYDKQLNTDLRVRLSGSIYTTNKSASNTLFGGDRGGSRFYMVMENTQATTDGNAFSGRLNPGFRNKVTSMCVNPFIKYKGLEFFGTYEQAKGSASNETKERTVTQMAGELVYRFLKEEKLFVGARYNVVSGALSQGVDNESIDRIEVSAGWFLNRNILLKGEYVTQNYNDFNPNNIDYKGNFHGLMVEAVVGF